MARQPAVILCTVVILAVSVVAVAGRALHQVQPPATPAALAFLHPPPSPAAASGLQTPPPPVPAAASAILQQPPADQQQGPAAAPYYYYIHVTRVGLLCVLVSFLSGCFLSALFIACVSRSTRAAAAARQEDVEEEGASVKNTAMQCLSCLTRVAAGV